LCLSTENIRDQKERDNGEDLDLDGMMMLKFNLEEQKWGYGLAQDRDQ
jgi:hypothetical protein